MICAPFINPLSRTIIAARGFLALIDLIPLEDFFDRLVEEKFGAMLLCNLLQRINYFMKTSFGYHIPLEFLFQEAEHMLMVHQKGSGPCT